MRNGNSSAESVLADTTYLLPLFGVVLKLPRFKEVFPRLVENFTLYYNPVSLVEAKWIILKLARRKPQSSRKLLDSYIKGLVIILDSESFQPLPLTSPEIEEESDRLLKEGLRDYFDRLLYATAAVHGMTLLTEDDELHEKWREDVIRDNKRPKRIVKWSELVSLLK